MYNFRSKVIILLFGIFLLVPAAYCFSLFDPSEEKVDQGPSDSVDVTSPTMKNDDAKDSTIDDNPSTKDTLTVDDNDATKDSTSNSDEPSFDENDAIPWPVIVVVEDKSALIKAKSESDSRQVDTNNNYLIVNKRTSIQRVEEMTRDFGKNRKVVSEDKSQELRVYRDNLHAVRRNDFGLTNILRF